MKSKDKDEKKKPSYDVDEDDPQAVVQDLLKEFPNIWSDLKQLLQLIDGGKAVDINGIAHKSLIKPLTTLFLSLHLKELNHGAFVLPPHVPPTLLVLGSIIDDPPPPPPPQRRPIGPEMPTPELLAAAAKLREAEAELREAELEEKQGQIFIGPARRVVAESASQGDRFQEVKRIMEAEDGSMYDILGADHNVSADNIKKRYLQLSLLVHPDKCSHPQASQAFVKLHKAFKEVQDPQKRRALDEKIKVREKQDRFTDVKSVRRRDEWMTEIPPERKHGGRTMQSTMAGSERARKAKMDYLNACNEFASLASNEEERKKTLLEKQSRLKRKYSKQQVEEEDWVGKHPWKPWDREKDLAGGRQSVKLDSEDMTEGFSSRFCGGSYQRNFL